MLERGVAAKKAKSVFFEESNTIDIYIEDTAIGYKKIFKTILNRILGEKFLINNVYPLGGRGAVVSQWENDKNKRNRPRLYIIDGDLNLILEGRNCQPGLYTLPFYCIENIFLCEDSLINVMTEEDPEREEDELRKLFNFNGWVEANNELLLRLFVTYALAKKHTPTLPSVSFGVSKLIIDNSGFVDETKVNSRIAELDSAITEVIGLEQLSIQRKQILDRIGFKSTLKYYVSGKDYLLPLITMRMKSIVDTRISKITMKHRMTSKCSINELNDLENFILM